MVNFQRYPKYKDSGVKWIGEIPEEWNIDRLKKSVTNLKNGIWGEEPQGDENDVFCIRVADFNRNKFEVEDGDFTVRNLDKEKQKAYMLKKDDLLIEKSGGGEKQPVGFVVRYNLDKPAIYANFMAKIELNKEIAYPNYFKYLYSSMYSHRINVRSIKQTTGIQNLDTSYYFQEIVPYPSIKEQNQIAGFLDEKTSEIDSLIADKEKLIELLEEKKQVIITEAVTKGLNPNVKMKDSGVEWIREIPEHWDIQPLFTLFKESKKKNVGNKEQNVLSLSYGKIIRRDVETNFGLLPESFETYQIVEKGYIVLRLTDLQNDKRSLRCGLVKEKGIITSAYVSLVPNDTINEVYAYYLLHAYDLFKVFYGLGSGVRQSMGFSDLKRVPILLPPKDEQNHIAEYLDEKNKEIDSLIIDLKKQITNLKEYRQSLIYEAVTGKIDVRDYVKA